MIDLNQLSKEHRLLVLPKHSRVTKELIRLFDNLLDFAPVPELRQTLIEVYHKYIISEHQMLPEDFNKIAANMYFLIDFLNDVEKEMKRNNSAATGLQREF
ncbi:hypothetical protein LVD17_22745 [Fulvivirga ulvae]|uniref:hypothetical protein n=1 Tax=Fulvivirga ulvae TaxID=2904245 RepID=UPI001F28B39D|nr:hypothetical protein [Fulvivirga ulvae]UII31114.1 hypothetical protein LVD17_22745 [Fulvivirga ulvae]